MLFQFWVLYHLLQVLNGEQLRFCEMAGTCHQCMDRRYSYYRCASQIDCLAAEICDGGFCCPLQRPVYAMQNESSSTRLSSASSSTKPPFRFTKPPESPAFPTPKSFLMKDFKSLNLSESNDQVEKCPDGSEWEKKCNSDKECAKGRICVEAKCCRTCETQRRLVLNIVGSSEVLGKVIPQCENGGTHYRRRQCLAGSNSVCWCVNPFGLKIDCIETKKQELEMVRKAMILRDSARRPASTRECLLIRPGKCPNTNLLDQNSNLQCSCDEHCYGKKKCCALGSKSVCVASVSASTTLVCASNEQFSACHSPCQPSCDDSTVMPCPSPTCAPGCHCQPGFIRRDGSAHSPCIPRQECAVDVTKQCSDELRQYQGCGSACPISCQNRNEPRCHERCVSGCFCRVPYILENGEDPLHSRCILPNECPLDQPYPTPIIPTNLPARESFARFPIPNVKEYNPYLPFYPTANTATISPQNPTTCADPLKNYLSCGTKCPMGCNNRNNEKQCSLSCVSGCFCRPPYMLLDANDPQSGCVLPGNCPVQSPASLCSDPRKEWTTCGALNCARSCSNLLGRCESGQCSPGCICREPYVLQDPYDPSSRCVLPSECERKCSDETKEFQTCGSSCPMGCDNRHPKSCAPCVEGCFCKNGLVLLNSTDRINGKCVRLEECPAFIEETPEPTTQPPTTTTASLPEVTAMQPLIIENFAKTQTFNRSSINSAELSSLCPRTTLDVGGRSCSGDSECPEHQHCCLARIATLGVNPQRCTCSDPLAVYSTCATLCPEYCGQPAVPVCSSTCVSGCQCATGYIKARNDVTAPCIPREACSSSFTMLASHDEGYPRATIKEVPMPVPEDPFKEQIMAAAHLRSDVGFGRITFTQISSKTMKVIGTFDGLPPGAHAIVFHKMASVGGDCSRIGDKYTPRDQDSSSVGDVAGGATGASIFSRVIDCPLTDVIGRSIAIYGSPSSSVSPDERPLACGTIGIANPNAN